MFITYLLFMLKQKIEPYKKFVQDYYHHIERDTAHDFRHIERIISRLDLLSQEIFPKPEKPLTGLKQKLSPNKPQTSFVSCKNV